MLSSFYFRRQPIGSVVSYREEFCGGFTMRMRRIKWAVEYLNQAQSLIAQPETYKNHWKKRLETECLHIEIGCGKGNYSLNMSKLYPNEGFVAIEKNESAAGITAKKYDTDTEKGKLAFIHGDAAQLIDWFGEKEVDVIHLNFSDPWPKNRYAKRRLSSKSFLEQYKYILSKNGEIQMKTDNAKLFAFSLIEFQNAGFRMKEVDVDYRSEPHEEDVMTEYEEKFVEKSQPIYRCVWIR